MLVCIHTTQTDAGEDEARSFFFMSKGALENPEKLLILIHGSGAVRAGQWARRSVIRGTQHILFCIMMLYWSAIKTLTFTVFPFLLNSLDFYTFSQNTSLLGAKFSTLIIKCFYPEEVGAKCICGFNTFSMTVVLSLARSLYYRISY